MEDKQPFFWIQIDGEKKLATQNLIPGNQVYNEMLVQYSYIIFENPAKRNILIFNIVCNANHASQFLPFYNVLCFSFN